MKANELRIGNYIESYGNNHKITEIFFGLVEFEEYLISTEEGITFEIDELKPIPLTEDLLLRFGFEKRLYKWNDGSESDDLFIQNSYFIGIHDGYNTISRLYRNEYQFLMNIESIHQLQNLYFALTGRELEIKQ